MRMVKMYEKIVTLKRYKVPIPDHVSDKDAEDWAEDEVLYNFSEDFSVGKEVILSDELIDKRLINSDDTQEV